MTNALEIKNLTKHYADFTLDNVSLTLPSGCIMGLIGENGAGKSTLIKTVLDLVQKDGGEVTVLGESDLATHPQLKESIGVVMDESSFPDNLTFKQIDVILKNIYRTWHSDVFYSYGKRFNLPEKKPVKEYSRGMKMKLSIAAALSHDSKLLILDEATSGLDPIVRDEMLDVFMDFIQDENRSIFISSHIVSDLEKICDYIAFIHQGRLLLCDTKDKLKETYGLVKCTKEQYEQLNPSAIIGARKNSFGVEALAKKDQLPHTVLTEPASIEDIMLYFVKETRQ